MTNNFFAQNLVTSPDRRNTYEELKNPEPNNILVLGQKQGNYLEGVGYNATETNPDLSKSILSDAINEFNASVINEHGKSSNRKNKIQQQITTYRTKIPTVSKQQVAQRSS